MHTRPARENTPVRSRQSSVTLTDIYIYIIIISHVTHTLTHKNTINIHSPPWQIRVSNFGLARTVGGRLKIRDLVVAVVTDRRRRANGAQRRRRRRRPDRPHVHGRVLYSRNRYHGTGGIFIFKVGTFPTRNYYYIAYRYHGIRNTNNTESTVRHTYRMLYRRVHTVRHYVGRILLTFHNSYIFFSIFGFFILCLQWYKIIITYLKCTIIINVYSIFPVHGPKNKTTYPYNIELDSPSALTGNLF